LQYDISGDSSDIDSDDDHYADADANNNGAFVGKKNNRRTNQVRRVTAVEMMATTTL
jgi:hypothetical protein